MKDRIGAGFYVGLLMAALLGLFGIVWVYTTTQRVRFLPEESAAWRAHIQMIKNCEAGNITVLGSSRASAAFVPRILGANVTNLAMSGGTPVEAYYEAKQLFRCSTPPKVIILGFSPLDWEGSTWFWTRSARYGLLSNVELTDIARNAAAENDTVLYHSSFGSEPPPAMKNLLYSTHFPPYDFASLLAAKGGRRRYNENIRLTNETLANRGQHLMYENTSACRTAYDPPAPEPANFLPRPLTVRYFYKLVDFLKSKHATVLYVATPMNEVEFHRDGSLYVREYVDFISSLHRQNANFDILGSVTPVQGLCDFADLVHVNQTGAETFSRRVAPMISAALTP